MVWAAEEATWHALIHRGDASGGHVRCGMDVSGGGARSFFRVRKEGIRNFEEGSICRGRGS